jgi:hypothetical protein
MGTARLEGDCFDIACLNCGPFTLTDSARAQLDRGYAPIERARISYSLRIRGGQQLTSHRLDQLCAAVRLPLAAELLDNLLLYLADELGSPGETLIVDAISWRARIGAQSVEGVVWAIEQCGALKYLQGTPFKPLEAGEYQLQNATLTVHGWQRVAELQRQAKDSKKAFMAMKFGDGELDTTYRDHLVPAVAQTGFSLRRLDDEPKAGSIDDRLRVEIRTSRFLLAELTHANAGAYWEAGYAEGLGRPVIYLCRKDVFDNVATRPHFDTNHHLTVVWDPSDLAAATRQLKSVIRVTLPSESILEN